MLNPAYDSSSTRRLPLAFGYVYGAGDTALSTTGPDGSQLILNILGEGEWDGPAMINSFANVAGTNFFDGSYPAAPPHLYAYNPAGTFGSFGGGLLGIGVRTGAPDGSMHFHSGAYALKGSGVQMTTSNGPDQGYDEWFVDFPIFTPPQCFSGIAYVIWRAPLASGLSYKFGFGQLTVSGMGVWRSTRCRIFDAYGNVTSYTFTCNPVWHKVEAILRYKIKPQQPPLAGLTAAEKACFNWESISELAARNDYILPSGNPRFVGNYIFASDATLTNMLELMNRMDRSFIREQNGQIYMLGNDPRSSVFLCSANHLVPSSKFERQKKDISKAANVFVPAYRDIDIPAVSEVDTVTLWAGSSTSDPLFGAVPSGGIVTFTLTSPNPFLPLGTLSYGGSSVPAMDGDYSTGNFEAVNGGVTANPNVVPGLLGGTSFLGPATGGWLGSNDARFSQRAPTTVQHRSAQLMKPAQAPGLATQPNIVPVRYDCGNSTYDQTNRLMKFERDSTLGTDTGAGWIAPISGSLTALLESVDANGVPLIRCGVHDVIAIDDWIFPEAPGDYEIMEMDIEPPSGDSLGQITLQLRQYNPDAPTDTSDPPGDSYQTVPSTALPLSGFTAVANAAWVLEGTPTGVLASDGTITLTAPDLLIQVMGQPTPTAYPACSWSEIAVGSPVLLFIDDPSGVNYPVGTCGVQPGSPPLTYNPAGRILVFCGSFTGAAALGSPAVALSYSPLFAPFIP